MILKGGYMVEFGEDDRWDIICNNFILYDKERNHIIYRCNINNIIVRFLRDNFDKATINVCIHK